MDNSIYEYKEFWRNTIGNNHEKTEIQTGCFQEIDNGGAVYRTGEYELHLDGSAYEVFHKVCNNSDVLKLAALTGVLNVLLYKYIGKSLITVGMPIYRQEDNSNYINKIVVIKTKIQDQNTFIEVLNATRKNINLAVLHQNYPLSELFEMNEQANSLFDIAILLDNLQSFNYLNEIEHSICFDFNDRGKALYLIIHYRKSKYKSSIIEKIGQQFQKVFRKFIENPKGRVGYINVLNENEINTLLNIFNNSIEKTNNKTLMQVLNKTIESHSNNIAIKYVNQKITYKELDKKSNIINKYLKKHNISKNAIVAVACNSPINFAISILGILKAGAAYLPIDIEQPKERTELIFKDCQPQIVIAESDYMELFQDYKLTILYVEKLEDIQVELPYKEYKDTDLAYVVYTSGTSGIPKGIKIQHKSIVNYILWRNKEYGIDSKDVILQTLSPAFDGYLSNFYSSLLSGATLVCLSKDEKLKISKIQEIINRHKVTHMSIVPTLFENVLANFKSSEMSSFKSIVFGGEQIHSKMIREIKEKSPQIVLINEYGPTECCVATSYCKDIQENNIKNIGFPIPNSNIFILNHKNELIPIGFVGELCIAGNGVSSGYINNDQLNKEKFFKNRYTLGRTYKTGDSAYWNEHGEIQILGRIDTQVKIKGFRIELGEIENTLRRIPEISEVVVLVNQNKLGENELHAYIMKDKNLLINTIKETIGSFLPYYMMPKKYFEVEYFPYNLSGKLDKMNLEYIAKEMKLMSEDDSPQTVVQKILYKIWQKIISQNDFGIKDNFFNVGADSLKATILCNEIEKEFAININVSDIFRHTTILMQEEFILSHKKSNVVKLRHYEGADMVEATSAQKRIFLLENTNNCNKAYNIPVLLEIKGQFDYDKYVSAVNRIFDRHESLKTKFILQNQTIMQIIDRETQVKPIYIESNSEDYREVISKFVKPFDLKKDVLFRTGYTEFKNGNILVMFDMHHSIADGISVTILINEFIKQYEAVEFKTLLVQYKDFSIWQNKLYYNDNYNENFKKQERFWLDYFSEDIPVLDLSLDYPRPAVKSFEGDRITVSLNKEIKEKLVRVCEETECTMFMLLFSCYNVLLSKYTNQSKIIVGTPISGRYDTKLKDIIGLFVNTLAIKCEINDEKSFYDNLQEFKENVLKVFEHKDYQFEVLVDKLGCNRDMSRNPLFDTMFLMQNMEAPDTKSSSLDLTIYDYYIKSSKMDLLLEAFLRDDKIILNFEYCSKLFNYNTIELLAKHFENIVKNIVKNIDLRVKDISLFDTNEVSYIMKKMINSSSDTLLENDTYISFFEKQAMVNPDSIAVVCQNRTITYRELEEKSGKLADQLIHSSVQAGDIVCIILKRDISVIESILAILRIGAAFMTIDPKFPEDRIRYMIEDSNAKIVISEVNISTKIELNAQVINIQDIDFEHLINSNILPNKPDVAYVLYTSGSTGKPKGVEIRDCSLCNFVLAMKQRLPIDSNDVFLALTTFSFDIFILETLVPLALGARVVIATERETLNMSSLAQIITKNHVSVLQSTPSRMQLIIKNKHCLEAIATMKVLLIGGEAFPEKLLTTIRENSNARIFNMYGPTETTVWSMVKELTTEQKITLGEPILNTSLYIVDKYLNLQGIGIKGELLIGGMGLAKGYYNREDLTQEKFIANPFKANDRLYRTGDLVGLNASGEVEFYGRMDSQVKVGGIRIEPGEIENSILSYNGISEVAVICEKDQVNESYLCAYFVKNQELSIESLKQYLTQKLPEYMIPAYFFVLDKLPRTDNKKIDRKALLGIENDIKVVAIPNTNKNNSIERKLLEIWKEILGTEHIEITDNFFEKGGNSLKAIQVVTELENEDIYIEDADIVFKYRTIEQLSQYIREII